jgi:hypothetical protein
MADETAHTDATEISFMTKPLCYSGNTLPCIYSIHLGILLTQMFVVIACTSDRHIRLVNIGQRRLKRRKFSRTDICRYTIRRISFCGLIVNK